MKPRSRDGSLASGMVLSLLLISVLGAAPVAHGKFVQNILAQPSESVAILYLGESYEGFDRPLPLMVDPSLLIEYERSFNRTQFIASIKNGYVTGVMGEVFDAQANIYIEFSQGQVEYLPKDMQAISDLGCKPVKRLASTIQKYGHMYYHFILEVLPRLILMRPYLNDQTKILMFGAPHEAGWLELLAIPQSMVEVGASPPHPHEALPQRSDNNPHILEVLPRLILTRPYFNDQTKILMFGAPYGSVCLELLANSTSMVEVYDPTTVYFAEEVIVPSPTSIITSEKEGFQRLREAYGASDVLPKEERSLVVYCSRNEASDRQVSNEVELIAALKRAYPDEELFRRAKVVVGMHGAGLSHIIFSAPGTAVVEFLFMYDPPMMFWHASGALGLRYVMLPLSQSWWLDPTVHVPGQDVIDALAIALNREDPTGCGAGIFRDSSKQCSSCPPATYRSLAGSQLCVPCAAGYASPASGAASFSLCPQGTVSMDGLECLACYDDEDTLFPGSASPQQCLKKTSIPSIIDGMFAKETLAKKLVSVPVLQPYLFTTAAAAAAAAAATTTAEEGQHPVHHGWNVCEGEPGLEVGMASWGFGRRLQSAVGLRQLQKAKFQMLDALFSLKAISPDSLEDDNPEEGASHWGAYSNGRQLSTYGIYGSKRRLASYGGSRALSSYGGGRGLSSYGNTLLDGRRLTSYGRRLVSYGRSLTSYGRSLSQYSRRLTSASSYGRSLSAYGRRLTSTLITGTRPLSHEEQQQREQHGHADSLVEMVQGLQGKLRRLMGAS
eukprot:gene12641-15875_t